jgi:hypothetical protein
MDIDPLIVKVEDAFGFSIPNEDAARLSVAGRLYDYVLEHRFRGKQIDRLRQVACYKIQRALMSSLKAARNSVQAGIDIAAVIHAHRRRAWRILEQSTGLRLPQLRRPAWVTAAAIVATFAAAIVVPKLLSLGPFNGAILLGLVIAIVVGRCLGWLTELLAFELQPDCHTIGQLAAATLARNFPAIVAEADKHVSDAEVWERLQVLVAERLGIPPRLVTKETSCMFLPRAAA